MIPQHAGHKFPLLSGFACHMGVVEYVNVLITQYASNVEPGVCF